MGNCAGIDWASEKHDVLVEDPAGKELLAATFAHDEDGVSALCATLVCFEVEVVAIERPDGLLVDRLLEAGVRVSALHPNQVKAARDRFRASGGKSDRFDRFVLCELARTDRHRFRLLEPDSDETKALRALTRTREDLVATRVALANQLRAELERFLPARPACSRSSTVRCRSRSWPGTRARRMPWAGREAPGRASQGSPLQRSQNRAARCWRACARRLPVARGRSRCSRDARSCCD